METKWTKEKISLEGYGLSSQMEIQALVWKIMVGCLMYVIVYLN